MKQAAHRIGIGQECVHLLHLSPPPPIVIWFFWFILSMLWHVAVQEDRESPLKGINEVMSRNGGSMQWREESNAAEKEEEAEEKKRWAIMVAACGSMRKFWAAGLRAACKVRGLSSSAAWSFFGGLMGFFRGLDEWCTACGKSLVIRELASLESLQAFGHSPFSQYNVSLLNMYVYLCYSCACFDRC